MTYLSDLAPAPTTPPLPPHRIHVIKHYCWCCCDTTPSTNSISASLSIHTFACKVRPVPSLYRTSGSSDHIPTPKQHTLREERQTNQLTHPPQTRSLWCLVRAQLEPAEAVPSANPSTGARESPGPCPPRRLAQLLPSGTLQQGDTHTLLLALISTPHAHQQWRNR